MSIKIFHILVLVSIWLAVCKINDKQLKNNSSSSATEKTAYQILLKPYDEIEESSIDFIQNGLHKIYNASIGKLLYSPLPLDAWYAERKRYWADTLLKHLKQMSSNPNMFIVGITGKDISTKKSKYPNWGVMGLGYMPGRACIISNYRLQAYPKSIELIDSQLLKVAIHEIGHNFGLQHCANETCYMTDSEGQNKLDGQIGFCKKCTVFLKNKNALRNN